MGMIRFRVSERPTDQEVDVPIEIWREEAGQSRFVKMECASNGLDAQPGVYHVRAWFPQGRHQDQRVEIAEDAREVFVQFHWSPRELNPKQQWRRKSTGPVHKSELRKVSRFEWSEQQRCYQFKESSLWQVTSPLEITTWYNTSIIIGIAPADDEEGPCDLFVAPVASGLPSRLEVVNDLASPRLRLLPHRPEAGFLLEYMRSGSQDEANSLVHSVSMSADQLLRGKRQDPVAAVIGGFVMLRLGLTDKLDDWPDLLYGYRNWLSDGVVLRSAQLCQERKPAEAADLLFQLTERGLPMLTDALAIALQILRLLEVTDEVKLSKDQKLRQRALRSQLGGVASYADRSEPLLTLRNVPVESCLQILGVTAEQEAGQVMA